MKNVLILMSTYNGGNHIRCQVESILSQKDVSTFLLIRDDGSKNETKNILCEITEKHKDRIKLFLENNVGWKASFQKLLHYPETQGFDYYGFSDQDDVWKENKIISCIRLMEADTEYQGPKLIQCNSITADEHLNILQEQEIHYASPSSKKMCIAQEYFRGCSMLWNRELMKIIGQYEVKKQIPHDYWVGLLGYWFGKIYYCKEPLFYHIRYDKNSSSDGNLKKARMQRLSSFIDGKDVYINPAYDLLAGYANRLTGDEVNFLQQILASPKRIFSRVTLAADSAFKRESRLSTILFKINILLGRY